MAKSKPKVVIKPVLHLNGDRAYQNILEWMYVFDGKYPNKNEWREELIKVLQFNLLGKH